MMEQQQERNTGVTAEQLLRRYVQENAELRFELIKLQMLLAEEEESDEH